MSNVQLQVNELKQVFVWNYDEIKAALTSQLEQYGGLVVNDDNLADMEKTAREIVTYRTTIDKFKKQVKSEMDKPYKQFEVQVKELLSLVDSVESPIKEQISQYETRRREEKTAKIQRYIVQKGQELSLGEQYYSQIHVAEKWLNRTAKWSETEDEILMRLAGLLDAQQKDRDAAAFRAEKIEMAKFLVESLSKELTTPITFAEIESRIDGFNLAELKEHIQSQVAIRAAREEAVRLAVAQAVEKAQESSPEMATSKPCEPVQSVSEEKRLDICVTLYGLSKAEYEDLKMFISAKKYRYSAKVAAGTR